MSFQKVTSDLAKLDNPQKGKFLSKFFKTGKGQYAEGDIFLGITVPQQRKVSKKYKDLPLEEISKLLQSRIHEHRSTALFILVEKFQQDKKNVFDFYIKHLDNINNWDLVDSSAYQIMGNYLMDKDRKILYRLAHSDNLWKKRIAIISTYYFIRYLQFDDTLKIAEILVDDTHDLIHKAVGWMLREVGKRDQTAEEEFLKKYYKTMPRTMLRYAIEKFDNEKKKFYMKK